jgi:O-methyltransferase
MRTRHAMSALLAQISLRASNILAYLKSNHPTNENLFELNADQTRVISRLDFFLRTKHLGGCVIECGVGQGFGLHYLLTMQKYFGDKRTIYAFDSFRGFPAKSENDSKTLTDSALKSYRLYNLESVKSNLYNSGHSNHAINQVNFIEGFMPESFKYFNEKPVSLVILDLDLYRSTKDALLFFWPLLEPGGIILIDEYDRPADLLKWPGVKLAVDEFCLNYKVRLRRGMANEPLILK